MLTINVISHGDDKVLNGSLNGEKFNVPYSAELYANLKLQQDAYNGYEDTTLLDAWTEGVKALLEEKKEDIIETACPDLKKDNRTGFYYVVVEGTVSKTAVPEQLVGVILESIEKEIDPTPIVKAWIRFLRNPNFTEYKAAKFASYITSIIIDEEEAYKLMEKEGFTEEVAMKRASYNDVCITTEGLLVAKKYGRLITEGYDIDPKTNDVIKVSLFPKTPKTVDRITGVVSGDEDIMPAFAEELYFQPPVQGERGDEFFNGDTAGHVMQVGKNITLEKWNMVNCNDDDHCVKGLHVGGYRYVQSYKSMKCQLLECFVDPAEIGAICDLNEYSDGAIRVREYFINGAVGARTKGIYHSSAYAKMKDAEWEAYKLEAVKNANKLLADVQEGLDYLGK